MKIMNPATVMKSSFLQVYPERAEGHTCTATILLSNTLTFPQVFMNLNSAH
jgi:hypothetical protein